MTANYEASVIFPVWVVTGWRLTRPSLTILRSILTKQEAESKKNCRKYFLMFLPMAIGAENRSYNRVSQAKTRSNG